MTTERPYRSSDPAFPCARLGGQSRRASSRWLSFSFALAVFWLAACATQAPDNTTDACAIFKERRGWWDAVKDSEKRWGAPPAVQLAIIEQESAFNSDARPERGKFLFVLPGRRPSSAYGYAQALDSTWEQYKEETDRRFVERDSFRDATDFVGWYMKKTRQQTGVSMSDAKNQYLAYHEGWGGYNRGSWRGKSGLVSVANAVAAQARTYDGQLNRCRKSLNRGFSLF